MSVTTTPQAEILQALIWIHCLWPPEFFTSTVLPGLALPPLLVAGPAVNQPHSGQCFFPFLFISIFKEGFGAGPKSAPNKRERFTNTKYRRIPFPIPSLGRVLSRYWPQGTNPSPKQAFSLVVSPARRRAATQTGEAYFPATTSPATTCLSAPSLTRRGVYNCLRQPLVELRCP